MRAALAGESGIGGFPWHLDDYGERMITLPSEVDGHRVRIGCDVMEIEDVHDPQAAVIKAFAEPDMSFPWREIEVMRDGSLPLLRLSGTVAERAQHQGWLSSSLSLSHADCHAMAVVLVVCSPDEVGA